MTEALSDPAGRRLDYLRLSVTGRCGMRCLYCSPSARQRLAPRREPMDDEEVLALARLLAGLGIRRIRVTGGEPLDRPGIAGLVGRLASMDGVEDLSLTTNGLELAPMARALAAAGLKRVNVSLDSLRPERFARITGREGLSRVMAGLEEALSAGLEPVKLNVVVMAGINDDEIAGFVGLTRRAPLHVRFIELMPVGGPAAWNARRLVPIAAIRRACGPLEPLPEEARPPGHGPAVYLRSPGAAGTVGFIGALSENFCGRCNRLRLTSSGMLLPCLADEGLGADLLGLLRSGAGAEALRCAVREAVGRKPRRHRLETGGSRLHGAAMCSVGG